MRLFLVVLSFLLLSGCQATEWDSRPYTGKLIVHRLPILEVHKICLGRNACTTGPLPSGVCVIWTPNDIPNAEAFFQHELAHCKGMTD